MRTMAVVTVAFLSACGSQARTSAGGIEGTVTAGPTCPVEIQGSPCPPQVWAGTVRATASDGSVHETETDSGGHYRLALEPGDYTVIPVVEGPSPPSARPADVTVGGSMQTLDLQVDTGIR